MPISRRSMLSSLPALAVIPAIHTQDKMSIPKGTTILFQGDSITDAGRNRGDYYANHGSGMGQGYVRQIATKLLGEHPSKALKIYNRGISGHKVYQLRARWEEDCLQLKPDVLSILIGVNDFWHTLSFNYEGTAKIYEDDFTALMDKTKKQLPDVKLIIGEPFVLHNGTSIRADKWRGAFEAYQAAAKQVADKFDGVFIPYQKIFTDALKTAPTAYWCPDGVHPSMAGNYLMAQAWLKAFKKVF